MIGIVGGVGPYAGIDLLRKVFDSTLAVRDQDHVDVILLSLSASIVDRTEFLEGEVAENPGYAISRVLIRLEAAGARVAGIPCNTAHAGPVFSVVTEELVRAGCTIKLLNMIGETVDFIGKEFPLTKKIGVLSTTGTYRSGLYLKALEERGYTVIRPTIEFQESVIHPAIYNPEYGIKAISNPVQSEARESMVKGFKYIQSQGAQAVIMGCTEIPIAFPMGEAEGMIAIDPTLVLARALIRDLNPDKLKPLSNV